MWVFTDFRGYKVRKEYGPLVSSGGKLDVETAHFIRHYCHKWKAKSMYQVLLLYRAKRYQDFVYFAQQAHMYNQSVVWNLQGNREPVDPSSLESRASKDFLESAADHKPNVFKLPFRLQDPLLLGVLSKVDPLSPDRRRSLMEDEPWDAPFRPKDSLKPSASMPQIRGPLGKRDQEVQTSLVSLRDSTADEDRRFNKPTPPSFKAPSYATTYREPRTQNQNKFNNGHDEDNNTVNKSGGRVRAAGAPAVGPPGGRRPFNPVAELELRGQRTSRHGEDSDDPPFNFQAMLRKTNHGRDSLKRRKGSGDEANGTTTLYGSGHGSNLNATSPSPSGRRSRSPRPDSPTRRPKDIPTSVRRRPGSMISTELAPGIIVHGHVADL